MSYVHRACRDALGRCDAAGCSGRSFASSRFRPSRSRFLLTLNKLTVPSRLQQNTMGTRLPLEYPRLASPLGPARLSIPLQDALQSAGFRILWSPDQKKKSTKSDLASAIHSPRSFPSVLMQPARSYRLADAAMAPYLLAPCSAGNLAVPHFSPQQIHPPSSSLSIHPPPTRGTSNPGLPASPAHNTVTYQFFSVFLGPAPRARPLRPRQVPLRPKRPPHHECLNLPELPPNHESPLYEPRRTYQTLCSVATRTCVPIPSAQQMLLAQPATCSSLNASPFRVRLLVQTKSFDSSSSPQALPHGQLVSVRGGRSQSTGLDRHPSSLPSTFLPEASLTFSPLPAPKNDIGRRPMMLPTPGSLTRDKKSLPPLI